MTIRDLLKPIMKHLERHPMSSNAEGIEYGVPNPSGEAIIGNIS